MLEQHFWCYIHR